MKVISFNTMYVKYEMKYNPTSKILSNYPDESKRLLSICEIILENIDINTIICLQECSSDLLYLLMQKLSDYNIFSVEIDKDVFMVTISHTSLDFKQEHILKSNYDKIAHGYLILNNNNIKIINCHLIPRFAAKKDMDIFSIIKENCKEKCIIAGDFNEKRNNLLKYLPGFNIPYFGATYKNKEIDHIILNFEAEVVANKINTYSVSDHEAIILDISC